jgi:predicted amidohydrolase
MDSGQDVPARPVTVRDLICSVLSRTAGDFPAEPPAWPPDVFAVTAMVLKRTGAYLCIAGGKGSMATPETEEPFATELPGIQKVAATWQGLAGGDGGSAPAEVGQWWRDLNTQDALDLAVDEVLANTREERADKTLIYSSRRLVRNLFRLLVAADEACRGAGLLDLRAAADAGSTGFYLRCANNLFWRWWWYPKDRRGRCSSDPLSSLCEQVHPTRAVVLPKIHVPHAGLTLNNLSSHLALCDVGSDVAPVWRWIPSTYHLQQERAGINVLVIPSPPQVYPSSFTESRRARIDKDSRYFSCKAGALDKDDRQRIIAAASLVEKEHGRLDVLVLPETAASTADFEDLCYELGEWAAEKLPTRDGIVVVAGVVADVAESANAETGRPAHRNNVAVSSQLAGLRIAPGRQQSKHHRWRLDGHQVRQYGLGSQLDPNKVWWEDIDISQRAIYFWSAGWLTASVLICEDLARQEPIAEVVRAVGPNLVVALLADGPQLQDRWSARYATVLADDPGCSVLTVTSLGMASMSRAPGKPASRGIALWKDASDGAVQIDLPAGAFGVVLSLTKEPVPKATADGRSRILPSELPFSKASRLKLSGIHPVAEKDLHLQTDEQPEPPAKERASMLQPYQSAAIATALFSLFRSDPPTQTAEGWPSDLKAFANWLPEPPDDNPPAVRERWATVDNDRQLLPLIRYLYGLEEIEDLESWARTAPQQLRDLVRQLRERQIGGART